MLRMSKVTVYAGANPIKNAGIYRYQLDTLKGTLDGGALAYECDQITTFHYSHFQLLASCKKENEPLLTCLDCHQPMPYEIDRRHVMDHCDCGVVQDKERIYTVNDQTNVITVYRKEHGKLKLEKRIKLKEHAECCEIVLNGQTIYVVCRGNDCVLLYDRDTCEPLEKSLVLPKGSAPEKLLIDPAGQYLYVLCSDANEIFVYKLGKHGSYRCQQICGLLPKGWKQSCISRKMLMSPNGKFLYVFIDGIHAVARFDIIHGNLKEAEMIESGGLNPYDALIDETGRWMIVIHKDSDNIIVFQMNPESGEAITITDEKILSKGTCLTFAYRI